MATMAIRIAVTTWPCPRLLSTPKADIGATGCITMTPYKIKSHNVSVLRRRTWLVEVSLLKYRSLVALIASVGFQKSRARQVFRRIWIQSLAQSYRGSQQVGWNRGNRVACELRHVQSEFNQ